MNILGLPFSVMFWGLKKMRGIVMENSYLKDLDKKDVFDYLICNRVFIDSLSFEEIKKYRKYFNNIYRLRIKNNFLKNMMWHKNV